MRVLIVIPHVFSPQEGSEYSSNNSGKKAIKKEGIILATNANICRFKKDNWIHASLGKHKPIITRALVCSIGVDIEVHVITAKGHNLIDSIGTSHENLRIIYGDFNNLQDVPMAASRYLLNKAGEYDVGGYIEDDLSIEDPEFFHKINYLVEETSVDFAFLPHRYENITNKSEVVLSGDPDGGRKDLFWDTGERIEIKWPLGRRRFYRATNPHSGCYFLTKLQATRANKYWERRNWEPEFQLSGPLEQAGSGILLPIFKIMKPVPEEYRFLMVRHNDELWKRHPFEKHVQ